MLVARGFAYILSEGRPIYEFPQRFTWLGRGSIGFGIPAAVALMAVIYALAWLLMGGTRLGRNIYAVGGNPESARLSGIPNRRVLMFVYTVTGALAGLGGVVMASQLKGGAGTYAPMYELYIIASVVVGGTSLAGGQGRIPGTLIGAFIIAVIQNGMNLTNVESYTQNVVLGFVILGRSFSTDSSEKDSHPLAAQARRDSIAIHVPPACLPLTGPLTGPHSETSQRTSYRGPA